MKIKEFDTIAAIATPVGIGGIGIVRISGEDAFNIANKIFYPRFKNDKNVKNFKTHTMTYGFIKNNKNQIIDEVLLSVMNAPKTYTCEDIVEINCHGGIKAVKNVLNIVLENGARLAQPGEFTKRAFINGRIDLSQAEAVIDVINAKTDASHIAAINNLDGKLKKSIQQNRNDILTIIANIEAGIDYPEHEDETMSYLNIKSETEKIKLNLEHLLKNADIGKIVKDGLKTVILGKPNVGKSSILNYFMKEERAIVSDIEGTTRDAICENVNIGEIFLNITDTAGLRQTDDVIEKIGVEKSKTLANKADLIFLVFDCSKKLDDEDFEILNFVKDKKVIIVANKVDLDINLDFNLLYKFIDKSYVIKTSVISETGFYDLIDKIKHLFFNGEININDEVLINNERNKNSIFNSINSLKNVLKSIESGIPQDILSIDLLDAYNYLGEVTGESLDEDVIDKIFSEFCLGK